MISLELSDASAFVTLMGFLLVWPMRVGVGTLLHRRRPPTYHGRVVNTWVLVLHGLWVTAGLIFLAASLLGPEDVTDDVSSRWTYNGSCIELSCYSLTPLD